MVLVFMCHFGQSVKSGNHLTVVGFCPLTETASVFVYINAQRIEISQYHLRNSITKSPLRTFILQSTSSTFLFRIWVTARVPQAVCLVIKW